MERIRLSSLTTAYPAPDSARIRKDLNRALLDQNRVLVVIDDDPTGVQTVHHISVFTDWRQDSIDKGFQEGGMFFILTNSRGMTEFDAKQVNRLIAERVFLQSEKHGKEFILISRSDSTLRGHYPLETATLRETIEMASPFRFDGEIISPFFLEGGRYTAGDIHYVMHEDELIPVGDTEFAMDKSFAFTESNLKAWVEEKTGGAYRREDVISIPLDTLRSLNGSDIVCSILMQGKNFCKIILNALCDDDIRVFCTGFIKALNQGKHYILRSSAAIPKILFGIPDQPLLSRDQLVGDNNNGGLVIIGSHVEKTTRQVEALKKMENIKFIEFNQHIVLDSSSCQKEIHRVGKLMSQHITQGIDTVVCTHRQRLDTGTNDPFKELHLSRKISDAITSLVTNLDVRPAYIVAKGGITSSDIGTVGLKVRKAMVLGQILPGIPVWKTGSESKFPGISYIIFPGNVGSDDALKSIVMSLRHRK